VCCPNHRSPSLSLIQLGGGAVVVVAPKETYLLSSLRFSGFFFSLSLVYFRPSFLNHCVCIRMTTTTSTPPSSVAPSISSFDPQLLKLLARHHHHQLHQQPSAKEFLQHAFYFNHPPPNTVATLSPRHHLSNGLSKLNTENSTKLSSSSVATINGKIDQQQLPTSSQIKKATIQQTKEAHAFDQWLQPPLGSIIQGPPCLQADTSSSSTATAGFKCETTLSSGMFITFQ
jgi:hypothetical protein